MQSKFTVYSFYELSRANIALEHCTATNVYIPNERAIQAVWLHIQLYNLGILVQFPKVSAHVLRKLSNCKKSETSRRSQITVWEQHGKGWEAGDKGR